MKKIMCLLALLLATSVSYAQSITLPPTVSVSKPGLVTIAPTQVVGDSVVWIAVDDGLQLIPSSLLKSDKTAVGVALQPGSYRVRAVVAMVLGGKAVMSDPVETTVVVGGTPPTPPNPPNPPAPTDPLTQAFQKAYNADTDATKSTSLGLLTDLMGAVVGQAKASGMVNSLLDLQTKVKQATDLAVGANAVPTLRRAIGDYLLTQLPAVNAAITQADWDKASTAYSAVSAALKGVRAGH